MRLLAAVAACLVACAAASGEEIALTVDSDGSGAFLVTTGVSGVDSARLLSSLSQGFEIGVTFELRLYGRTSGLRSLLGDRLLEQVDLARRASMDVIDGRYILFDETDDARLYDGGEDLVRDLLSLHSFRLPWPVEPGMYLLARARLDYVRLDPPLHIVTLFRPTAATTDWRRADLASTKGRPR